MKVAILAAIIAGTVTSAQAFTTLCRSYSDGVFSFIECADGTYIVIGPGGGEKSLPPPMRGSYLGGWPSSCTFSRPARQKMICSNVTRGGFGP